MGDDTTEPSSTKVSIELLRINGLLIDDKEAFDRYPRIKARCEELITQERHTGITKEEKDDIFHELFPMMEVNEETFVGLLWPALIRGVRHKNRIGVSSIAKQGEAPILTA